MSEEYRAELTAAGCIVLTMPVTIGGRGTTQKHTVSIETARVLYTELKEALIKAGHIKEQTKQEGFLL